MSDSTQDKISGISRRHYLQSTLTALAAAGLIREGEAASASAPKAKPNILVIMSDEHNASVLGSSGNALARTPNLDALAARGVVFENAYTNSPLCVPSRLSFTSGKYVSRVGAWSNSCWLPSPDFPSLPRVLNEAGYETVLCGKMHYDKTQRYGFSRDLEPQLLNQGTMTGKGSRRKATDLEPAPGISGRLSDLRTGDTSNNMEHDLQVTRSVSAFLKDRTARDKPFFVLAGYITPHFPLTVPESYWRNFEGKIPPPNIPDGYLDN